jgi:hypothetical protein
MTDPSPGRGHPFIIKDTTIEAPAWLMPWLHMVEGMMRPNGAWSPTSKAAEMLNTLMAAGWIPPNAPETPAVKDIAEYEREQEEAKLDEQIDLMNEAAREVADLLWRSTTCSDEEAPGIRAMTIEALRRYRMRMV